MEVSNAKRLKSLEDENTRLKRLLADAMLGNAAPAVPFGWKTLPGSPSPTIGAGIWRGAIPRALRKLPSLPPPNRANATVRANSELDKTWGNVTRAAVSLSADFGFWWSKIATVRCQG